jgi:hypothetical protein
MCLSRLPHHKSYDHKNYDQGKQGQVKIQADVGDEALQLDKGKRRKTPTN